MTAVHVVRVFTDAAGNFGNPLGVVLGSAGLSRDERQAIATGVGFSETVFVEDVDEARLRIHTPAREIPLAGHPLVGTSWFLCQHTGSEVSVLRPMLAANVDTWRENGVTWVRARVADAPDWNFVQLESPDEIERLAVPPGPEYDMHEFWAWQDEAAGRLRARVFAASHQITEDEATGSGALRLVARMQRSLVITQGRGSVIHARPARDRDYAEVGGLVVGDGVREV
jgi:predicted PhzF superfamily epimerase YddE/YHI9